MHDVTVRRFLVFGVCAVGVASLYTVPSIARTPQQGAEPQLRREPAVRPSASVRDVSAPAGRPSPATSPSPTSPRPGPVPDVDDAAEPPTTAEATEAPDEEPTEAERSPAAPHPGPSRTGATASDEAEPRDEEAPDPVADITSAALTPSRLTVRWPAAADNVGVVGYTVVLNGYQVATTPATSATVRWFNDDARDHVVRVLAVDAAGNQSPSSPNLLVARPTPAPTPAASGPTADPAEPTTAPQPAPAPLPEPSEPTTAPSQDDPRGESATGDAEPSPSPTDEEN